MDVEVVVKAGAATLAAIVAVAVLFLGPRRLPHAALAGFLVLVSANQGVEAARLVTTAGAFGPWPRLAAVFAVWDPFLLYVFVESFPRAGHRPRPGRIRWAAVGAIAVTVGLISLGPAVPSLLARSPGPAGRSIAVALAIGAYTAVLYVASLRQAVRWLHEEPTHRALGWLVVGLGALALVAAARAAGGAVRVAHDIAGEPTSTFSYLGWNVGASVAVMALSMVGLPRFSAARLRAPGAYVTGGVAVAVVAWVLLVVRDVAVIVFGVSGTVESYGLPGRMAASVRLAGVALALGVALVRYDLLGVPLARRAAAARAASAVGLAVAVAVLVGGAATAMAAVGVSPLLVAALAGAILVVGGATLQRLINRVAAAVHAAPTGAARLAALATYQEAAELAWRDGRRVGEDSDLRRLAGELGLSRRETLTVEALAARGTDRSPLAPGRLVAGRYRVQRLLAIGGSGRVFLGRDHRSGDAVVLKEVFHDGSGRRGADEARAAARVRHPHVVAVRDVVDTGVGDVLVMEHVAGGTLEERLRRQGRMAAGEARELLVSIASGVEALHAAGLVHGDLKPGNVFLDAVGSPRVGDLGSARDADRATVRVDAAAWTEGTPGFVAPEVVRGLSPTPAADVYALGRLVEHVVRRPLPRPLAGLVARARAEDPGERPPDGEAFRVALAQAFDAASGPEEEEAAPDPDELAG